MKYIALIGYQYNQAQSIGADFLEFEADSYEAAENILKERIDLYYVPDSDKTIGSIRLLEVTNEKEMNQ